jgi:hypothetical protein
MSERGTQLLDVASRQIGELLGLLSTQDEEALRLPCPGREKLGDGTVAAIALHTADNYLRIAGFLQATSQTRRVQLGAEQGSHGIRRFLLGRGHAPRSHAEGDRDVGTKDGDYTAEKVDLRDLLERLSAGRGSLSLLADLTDDRLDTVPPAGSFKFCDGQRTMEQVIAGLLNHQAHHVDAVKAAVA